MDTITNLTRKSITFQLWFYASLSITDNFQSHLFDPTCDPDGSIAYYLMPIFNP